MSVSNALFNQWFMFGLGMGIAGSAWGTVAATALGVVLALAFFVGPEFRLRFRSHLTWRRLRIARQFTLGLPMGLSIAADLFGFALFQLMLVRVGAVAGAATQIVTMLTSLAYGPGVGIALAGTTLVGQSIGQRRPDWAATIGNAVIRLVVIYMGGVAVLLALFTPWVAQLFVNASDPNAGAVLALCARLMWIAAAFQIFDGLNLGSGFCLRGAGDARVPALLVAGLAWGCWVPLTHMLTFARGEGYVNFLPQFGLGPTGGWWAALIYVVALGLMLHWRWRSGAWRQIRT
jgi:MATE family multidrug resistance protein